MSWVIRRKWGTVRSAPIIPAPQSAACVDSTLCPKVAEGIGTWVLFPAEAREDSVFIVGHQELDRYLAVPGSVIDTVSRAITFFDGRHSIERIEAYFATQERKRIDITHLYKQLAAAGLVPAAPRELVKVSDFESTSVALMDIGIQTVTKTLGKHLRRWLPLAMPLSIIVAIGGAVQYMYDAGWIGHSKMRIGTTSMGPIQSAVYLVLFFASILAHESSHGLAAASFGLFARRLRLALYMGIVPIIYLRIGGLYTLSPLQRIIVWLAGVYANFVLGSLGALLIHWGYVPRVYTSMVYSLVITNYSLAVFNLFPFLPTDGYYVASTLCKTYNVRARAWRSLKDLLRGRWHRMSGMVVIYMLVTIFTITSFFVQRVRHIYVTRNGGITSTVVSLLLLFCPMIIDRWARKRHFESRLGLFAVRWLAIGSALYVSGALGAAIRWLGIPAALQHLSLLGTSQSWHLNWFLRVFGVTYMGLLLLLISRIFAEKQHQLSITWATRMWTGAALLCSLAFVYPALIIHAFSQNGLLIVAIDSLFIFGLAFCGSMLPFARRWLVVQFALIVFLGVPAGLYLYQTCQ